MHAWSIAVSKIGPFEFRNRIGANLRFGVNVAGPMLGDDAERKKGPFIMQDHTVNGTLVANDSVRPDTSILPNVDRTRSYALTWREIEKQ